MLPAAMRQAGRAVLRAMPEPGFVIAFVSAPDGLEAGAAEGLCDVLGETVGGARLVVETVSVVGDAGSREGLSAVSLMAFARGVFEIEPEAVMASEDPIEVFSALRDARQKALRGEPRRPRGWMAFLGKKLHHGAALAALRETAGLPMVGAAAATLALGAAGAAGRACDAVILPLRTALGVSVATAQSFLRKTPWLAVTGLDDGAVASLEGRAALDVVGEVEVAAPAIGPTLLAIEGPDEATLLVRTVSSVDAAKRSLRVAEPIGVGQRVSLGLRDPELARAQLAAQLDGLLRARRSNAPAAVLMLSCAGRGSGFYGQRDVDAGAVRARWRVPLAGAHVLFEISPVEGRGASLQLCAAVVMLFDRPS